MRRVNVSRDVREIFECAGERRLIRMFSDNLVPDRHDQDLLRIYEDQTLNQQARAWLLEQEDKKGSFEFRMGDVAPGKRLRASARS